MYDRIRGDQVVQVPRFKRFPWFFKIQKLVKVEPATGRNKRIEILTEDLTLGTRMMIGRYFQLFDWHSSYGNGKYWNYMHEVIDEILAGRLPLD